MDTTLLRDLAISDTGFVFDPYTGHTFTVNATGLVLLRALVAGTEASELSEKLRDAFECDEGQDPNRDIQDFLGMLRDVGLVR